MNTNHQILPVQPGQIPLFIRLLFSQVQKAKIQKEIENNIYDLLREWLDTFVITDLIHYFTASVFNFADKYCQKNNDVLPESFQETIEFLEDLGSNEYFMQSLRDSLMDTNYSQVVRLASRLQKGGF